MAKSSIRILWISGVGLLLAACTAAIALTVSPPVSDIHINGHTYTNSQLQADPAGWIGGIANDVGAVTALYPTGRFNPRIPLTGDLSMFISPTGSDANNCLVGNPCQTPQRAIDLLRDQYDLAGFQVTIQLASGSYSSVRLRGRLVGQQSPASLTIHGNSSSPTSVQMADLSVPTNLFETGAGTALYASWGALVTVDGVTLIGGHRDMWANNHAEIRFLNIVFGGSGATDTHLAASHGAILRARGNYTVTGNASRSHALAADGGEIMLSDVNAPEISPIITFSGNPSVGITFEAQRRGEILVQSSQTTLNGTVVGQKFSVDTLGLLWTNGSGGTGYIPGTIGGTATNGGIFN
jgi:hypothetical protein